MNVLLLSMPDSFEHSVAIADLILVQDRVEREIPERVRRMAAARPLRGA